MNILPDPQTLPPHPTYQCSLPPQTLNSQHKYYCQHATCQSEGSGGRLVSFYGPKHE